MRSKKSFCNMTVLRHDIITFWPLWGILFIWLQAMQTLPLFFFVLSHMKKDTGTNGKRMLLQEGAQRMYETANPYLICVFAVLAAVMVFGYLFKKKENYLMHSFPVKREVYFCSHFLSGFLMLAVPYVISYLIMWGICGMSAGNYAGVMFETMMGTLLEVLVIILFFYTLSCVVVMLSGSPAITVIIYFVLNVLVAGLTLMVSAASEFVLNYTVTMVGNSRIGSAYVSIMEHFTPLVHFSQTLSEQMTGYGFRGLFYWEIFGLYGGENMRDWGNISEEEFLSVIQVPWQQVGKIMWYVIPAVLFFALACYLYKKRRLERVGESLAFPWGNAVFHGVFTICGGYIFANAMYWLSNDALEKYLFTFRSLFWIYIVYLCLGCVICFIVSNMILQRTFRIWKGFSFVQLGGYTACVLGLMLLVRYQCYQGHLPDAKEVDRMEIQIVSMHGDESGSIIVDHQGDIAEILSAVQGLYDNAEDMPLKQEYYRDEDYNLYLDMGNQGGMELNISCLGVKDFKEQYDMVSDIINNPSTMMEKILTKDYKNLEKEEYTIYVKDEENSILDLDKVRLYKKELLQALEKDLTTGEFTFADMIDGVDSEDNTRLFISVYPYEKDAGKKSDARFKSIYGDFGIRLSLKFTNFWKTYSELVEGSVDK